MQIDHKELITWAAKAAGIQGEWQDDEFWLRGDRTPDNDRTWAPHLRDGDSRRLAVRLHIDTRLNNGTAKAVWVDESLSETHAVEVPCDEGFEGWDAKYFAVRVAVLMAAAAIGKAME